MYGEILSVVLRLALATPKLIDSIEGAVGKIEADPTIGAKVLDALRGLESALADVLPGE